MMLAGDACAGGGACAAEDTRGDTGEDTGAEAPGALDGLATSATLAGTTTFTFPSLNPASCKLRLALPSGCPTKLGITNACGSNAAVTSKLIFGAATCVALALGLCAST